MKESLQKKTEAYANGMEAACKKHDISMSSEQWASLLTDYREALLAVREEVSLMCNTRQMAEMLDRMINDATQP